MSEVTDVVDGRYCTSREENRGYRWADEFSIMLDHKNQRDASRAGEERGAQSEKDLTQMGMGKMVIDRSDVDVETDVLSPASPRTQRSSERRGHGNISFPNNLSWARRKSKVVANQTKQWYKKYACHMLLRQREIPRSNDGRHISLDLSRTTPLVDERTGKHYVNNTIRSSRYTIWTFLPLQLWFQFTKIANFYFLIMGILQLIPGLSTTGTYTTILPLLFFLSFSIAREGYDDFRRYRLDRVENRRLARVLRGSSWTAAAGKTIRSFASIAGESWKESKSIARRIGPKNDIEASPVTSDPKLYSGSKESSTASPPPESENSAWATVKWIDLKVGDVIEIRRDEQLPADIVLLYSDGRDGIAYIETMALDGETNLKCRRPPDELAKRCGTVTDLARCRANFAVEDPDLDLYDFHGKVSLDDSTLPLTLENVIFRGSTLRNTKRAVGMIVNTGEECKIRMNANKKPQTKAPAIQYMTNRVVILLTIFVILLSIGCTAGYEIWTPVFENRAWYLDDAHLPLEEIFIAFAIEFNNLIPLALYVSLEIIKFAQFLLLQDIEMYDPVSDTPVVCNTQTIFENLGQVGYIFSDKTGTLTENVMRFRKMGIAGTAWRHKDRKEATSDGNESTGNTQPRIEIDEPSPQDQELSTNGLLQYIQLHPSAPFTAKAQVFLLALALCHTCFPETQANGDIAFQATSPDETALVEAAQDLGYLLVDRSTHSATLLTQLSGTDSEIREKYEILDVIEFSSKRKRMSVIVKFADGRICLLCKGADSVILPRLKVDEKRARDASPSEQRKRKSIDEMRVAKMRRSMQEDSMNSLERLSIGMGRPELSRLSSDLGFRLSVGFERAHETLHTARGYWREKSVPSSDPALAVRRVVEEAQSLDDAAILERCRQQIDDFACEGLRTLVYGYRLLGEAEYASWHKTYHEATTSLTNRQEMIEAAGELIEQNLDLAGATAIEDKLQKGVPETIEKLQRANIKIWMLTGDKRETAINIAHSARICKPYSQVVILDQASGDLEQKLTSTLLEVSTSNHTVVVIDGQTLVSIEKNETLTSLFYELLLVVGAVICCRASPSQKASIVKNIRRKLPKSITLAIGDGGNDIAMIQEAHVGVGISGKEGLQAARVADYSIAQFRFLQRLLLVHGHWNYVRTAKYILLTFWKEMLFYSAQVMYQRWNGYTGTSLYESNSLTVWNTLFTSLPVMLPGIFEQDLSAETLLAVPELYGYGQESKGFDMWKYTWWMLMAAFESQVLWWMTYFLFGVVPITDDQSLFAIGNLAFSVCVVFINVKLL